MSSPLDERIAKIAEQVLAFATEYELFPGLEPPAQRAKASAIATFASLCAPADAHPSSSLLAAHLLAILLGLDDLSRGELDRASPEMLEVLRDRAFTPREPEARALAAYLRAVDQCGDTTWFRAQFEQCIRVVREEARLLAEGPLTVAAYQEVRHRLVFVDEYIWSWLLSERLPFDAAGLERTARLRRLACDLVYMVNDLGGLERDRGPGRDPNLVHLIAGEQRISEQEAIEVVVRMHDETVAAYRTESKDLRTLSATPAVLAMIGVVEFVVRGNLATTRKLSTSRYPGAAERLARLADY